MHRMHADELEIDADLVRRLLTAQFPRWSELSLERITSAGTDNAIFRLGDELVVRLPRIHWSATDADREFHWLHRLARHLPVAVPVPIALGLPSNDFPWHWSVCPWLPGADANMQPFGDLDQAARDLGQVVAALHEVDSVDGPPHEAPRAGRGVPLSTRDAHVRAAIEQLKGAIDTDAVNDSWAMALEAPDWEGVPRWIHGDLQPANLLVEDGRLTGVIDWGGLGVGDPASDLLPAWSFFSSTSRDCYRSTLAVDEATWARGRGWALSVGLIALPYYIDSNPTIVDWARRLIDSVIADQG